MYFNAPSTGELLGCLAVVAGFFMGLGALAMWLIPKAWDWLKPIIHAVTG